ncbi:uncharacterized protein TEOVI_000256700 [Trypanosoma equiperdum]|uniref:Uncharacterized protein n=1 Tax=Trypanosoma equiperdum TaxID=5694 RepID=A0A1G4IF20_TRYEQ|nr:hypothetical protein, conserved [Trypanosoma equiperdum]
MALSFPSSSKPHACASLRKVFEQAPGAPRRPYLPKGSRTHISLTAAPPLEVEGLRELGVARLVRSYGDINKDERNNEDQKGSSEEKPGDPSPREYQLPVVLTGLIAADGDIGTCLTRRTVYDGDDLLWRSPALPSGQRICCVELCRESHSLMVRQGNHVALFPTPRLYTADVVGNVYVTTLPASSVGETNKAEPPAKRRRVDNQSSGGVDEHPFWEPVVAASTSGAEAYGARGWCGLTPLADDQVVCCREFFFDLRLLDARNCGAVIRQYGTLHAPTGMATCGGIFPHGVVVAEGPVASVYDTRCSGAVMTQQTEAMSGGQRSVPLVSSRFTDATARVADVCATCNEFEVAIAVGRAVCVHDIRKWTRVSITTSVLKYDIGSIAPFACGKGVVAAGIDAEVRLVLLTEKLNGASSTTGTVVHGEGNCCGGNGFKKEVDVDVNGGAAVKSDELTSVTSFRNRIDSVVSCRSTWQGGWVPSVDASCATGISADHEFFMAF